MTLGTVVGFDEAKGYGTVRADDGRELFFHCTTITDGSRAIAEGAPVTFRVVAAHGGRWEARDVEPLPRAAAPRTASLPNRGRGMVAFWHESYHR